MSAVWHGNPLCWQVGGGRVESLQQELREAGLPDPGGAVHAGAPQQHQPARPQQTLHREPSRGAESLQPHHMPRPVEDGGVVAGEWACFWRRVDIYMDLQRIACKEWYFFLAAYKCFLVLCYCKPLQFSTCEVDSPWYIFLNYKEGIYIQRDLCLWKTEHKDRVNINLYWSLSDEKKQIHVL